jgi:D-threo-aldose 1-dehydrogenase
MMRTVALPGTGLSPSRLGFGSAPLMARLGRRESVRLLEAAYDSGITHFDTARSYGHGEAESAVAELLSRHRDGITVTTKLGIVPPQRSRGLQAAKAVVRAATRHTPSLRARVARRAHAMSQTGRFEPEAARQSLDTSLHELRTDAVDILLLHECSRNDVETEGLLDFLEGAVRDGKVRNFGIATNPESTGEILRERPELARVVQVPHNASDRALQRLPSLSGVAVITHSALRPLVGPVAELMRDEARRERWSRALGVDCARRDVVGRLLLAYALESNPDGMVLFASTDVDRIRSNAALSEGSEFSSKQIAEFARLAREAFPQSRGAAAGAPGA